MYVQCTLVHNSYYCTPTYTCMHADSMVAEVLEAVHHLDATYAAFYTAMMSEAELESNTYVCELQSCIRIMYLAHNYTYRLITQLFTYTHTLKWLENDSSEPFVSLNTVCPSLGQTRFSLFNDLSRPL